MSEQKWDSHYFSSK